jgi:hypothetical protein
MSSSTSRLPVSTNRALARLQQQAIVSAAKVQAQAYVGREALFAVADLSELEGQLAQLCPLATSRLEVIANMTAIGIARTVSEFRG